MKLIILLISIISLSACAKPDDTRQPLPDVKKEIVDYCEAYYNNKIEKCIKNLTLDLNDYEFTNKNEIE